MQDIHGLLLSASSAGTGFTGLVKSSLLLVSLFPTTVHSVQGPGADLTADMTPLGVTLDLSETSLSHLPQSLAAELMGGFTINREY